ncbi:MAG: hypothetical protein CML47_02525 [Rhodobacteraceae bacterium]|nr:MAG: hypothetical protein CML47_02525 [Paracoccaceae bacterium]
MSLKVRLKYIIKNNLLFKSKKQHVKVLAIGVDCPSDLLILTDFFQIKRSSITFQNNFKPHLEEAEALGFKCSIECKDKHDLIILAIPNDKKEALGLVSKSLKIIKEKGYIVFDGQKSIGIESIVNKLSFLNFTLISKAHGKLVLAPKPKTIPHSVEEWDNASQLSLNKDNFLTSPGMFSYKKIDSGSELLGNFLGKNIKGQVADLCSGWGYLSIIALEKNSKIKKVCLFEANYAALMASKQNLKDPRACFHWEDVINLPDQEKKFDFVICNPPFHSKAKYDIMQGRKVIKTGYKILKFTGSFFMVANKHLPYERNLRNYFSKVDKMTETPYFKVFRATKPIINP